jgi:hypothetical protein
MIAKLRQLLLSIANSLVSLCSSKCTRVVCTSAIQRRWLNLDSSKQSRTTFSKRQIASATRAKDLFKKMIFPSTADFRAVVSAGGAPGSDVTLEDVKAAEVIWGRFVLKMKGNTVSRNSKKVLQIITKVPTELIKLHHDVELAIDVFFVNKHIFFTTYSTKICFAMVTHLAYHEKEYIWEALLVTYNMYLHQGFRITVISGDQEFSVLNHLTTVLPTAPHLDWAAASQHCGLLKRNICFLKEKLCSLCHSLPFTTYWELWLSVCCFTSLYL